MTVCRGPRVRAGGADRRPAPGGHHGDGHMVTIMRVLDVTVTNVASAHARGRSRPASALPPLLLDAAPPAAPPARARGNGRAAVGITTTRPCRWRWSERCIGGCYPGLEDSRTRRHPSPWPSRSKGERLPIGCHVKNSGRRLLKMLTGHEWPGGAFAVGTWRFQRTKMILSHFGRSARRASMCV